MKQINVDSTKPFELHYFHLHVFDKLSDNHKNFHHPNLTWAPCCFALIAHYLGWLLNSNSTQLSHNYLYKYILFHITCLPCVWNFSWKNHQFFNITKLEKKTLGKAHLL